MTDDELRTQVAELAARVRCLEDEREIRDVLAAYGYNADLGRHEEFVELFTTNAVMDLYGGEPSRSYPDHSIWKGHQEIQRFINDPMVHMSIEGRSMHLPSLNPRIRISGEKATAETYVLVVVQDRDQRTIGIYSAGFTRWEFLRVDGRWRIALRQRVALAAHDRRRLKSLFGEAPHSDERPPGATS